MAPAGRLSRHILLALILGLLTGLLLKQLDSQLPWLRVALIDGLFLVLGQVFIRSLQLLVVPLVFVSLVCGTSSLTDLRQLGRLGSKTLLLYLATTAFAIALAIVMALLLAPGIGVDLPAGDYQAKPAPPLSQVLIELMPRNPIEAMASGNMLQIIVFALLFGLALSQAGVAGQRLTAFFHDLNEVVLKLVQLLIRLAPYGVFCLIARVFFELGWDGFAPLANYFAVVLLTLLLHGLLVYPLCLLLLARLNPWPFLRKMRPVQLFAFSTASSNATLPITLATVRDKLGVDNRIAAFTVPLGATINMDGTAIMQGVATVFIAQVYGIELSLQQYLMVIFTAVLASVGTAGVPGVGLVMLTLVLEQVGLPVAGIALIIGIDRLLDMTRTAVNITGDAMVSCVIAKQEQALDFERYQDDEANASSHHDAH